jgi:hypothetical protein
VEKYECTIFALAAPIIEAKESIDATFIAETVLKAFIKSSWVFGPMPVIDVNSDVSAPLLLRFL